MWQAVSQIAFAFTDLFSAETERGRGKKKKRREKCCTECEIMQKLALYASIYLFMLISVDPVALDDSSQPTENAEKDGLCNACTWRQNTKSSRIEAIKIQILSKLRLEQAPNISRDVIKQLLPKAPPLQELIDQYDVQRDDSSDGSLEDDDYHATTETIITMPTECK